ncbi:MAG: hypothetical protein D3926_15535 [Desulfobacteraceae bacterium]|nr:MAG: hypothetical protein D3926_15535 [Desulfobacteraceae bacterium]
MNTQRSEKKAAEYLKTGNRMKRKIQVCTQKFNSPREKVFHQLCPTRELDWINGWECDLVYTTTGYVEPDCIFRTSPENSVGEGLWIFTNYVLNEKVEIVRIIGNCLVMHMRITLADDGDGTSTGTWHMTLTALNEEGNAIIEAMPEENAEIQKVIQGLEHFLNTGDLVIH